MSTTKSPVDAPTPTGHDTKATCRANAVTFVNFNDSTALHIFQVLSDLLAEQKGLEPVKLTLKKEA